MPLIATVYGWECPKCQRIWAPWVPVCNCTQLSPTIVDVNEPCPSCGQNRAQPPLTGCQKGSHYGVSY